MSSSNALRPCLNPTGEEALPSLFGNHPISSGFLRRIFSRTIMAIPTTEKDRNKPSSRFRHIYASVCTSYAAVCSPYALYAPLLGVGAFSALFLLRELHTVHKTTYGSRCNQALALLPVGIGASSARRNRKCIRRCIRLSGRKAPIDPLLSERRDSFGMASEPMDGIRPCGPLQGPFRGLPAVRRVGTVPAAKGCRRGPGAPDA